MAHAFVLKKQLRQSVSLILSVALVNSCAPENHNPEKVEGRANVVKPASPLTSPLTPKLEQAIQAAATVFPLSLMQRVTSQNKTQLVIVMGESHYFNQEEALKAAKALIELVPERAIELPEKSFLKPSIENLQSPLGISARTKTIPDPRDPSKTIDSTIRNIDTAAQTSWWAWIGNVRLQLQYIAFEVITFVLLGKLGRFAFTGTWPKSFLISPRSFDLWLTYAASSSIEMMLGNQFAEYSGAGWYKFLFHYNYGAVVVRNEVMADNIAHAMEQPNVQLLLVNVGAGHLAGISRCLEERYGFHEVSPYGFLKTASSTLR